MEIFGDLLMIKHPMMECHPHVQHKFDLQHNKPTLIFCWFEWEDDQIIAQHHFHTQSSLGRTVQSDIKTCEFGIVENVSWLVSMFSLSALLLHNATYGWIWLDVNNLYIQPKCNYFIHVGSYFSLKTEQWMDVAWCHQPVYPIQMSLSHTCWKLH